MRACVRATGDIRWRPQAAPCQIFTTWNSLPPTPPPLCLSSSPLSPSLSLSHPTSHSPFLLLCRAFSSPPSLPQPIFISSPSHLNPNLSTCRGLPPEWNLQDSDRATFVGICFCGFAVGTAIGALLGDFYGRCACAVCVERGRARGWRERGDGGRGGREGGGRES